MIKITTQLKDEVYAAIQVLTLTNKRGQRYFSVSDIFDALPSQAMFDLQMIHDEAMMVTLRQLLREGRISCELGEHDDIVLYATTDQPPEYCDHDIPLNECPICRL